MCISAVTKSFYSIIKILNLSLNKITSKSSKKLDSIEIQNSFKFYIFK